MKHLFRSIATTTLLGVATAAHANCWRDRDIEQTLNEVIAMHFPGTDAPDIIACDGGHFGPNVGGDYNSGRRQIRINIASYPYPGEARRVAIAHELGHHVAAGRGANNTLNGHGVEWMAVMRAAGFDAEVRRTFPFHPGMAETYAAAFGPPQYGGLGGAGEYGDAPIGRAAYRPYSPPHQAYQPGAAQRGWAPPAGQGGWRAAPARPVRQCQQREQRALMPTPYGMRWIVVGIEERCH